MKKSAPSKQDKPHPMLHGQHDGKMPAEHKALKEKQGSMMKAKVKKKTAKVKK